MSARGMEVGALWKRSHSNRSEAALHPAHVKTATRINDILTNLMEAEQRVRPDR